CAACGSATNPRSSSSATAAGATGTTVTRAAAAPQHPRPPQGGFSWFAAKPPPAGWRRVQIPDGAAMFYPASWSRQRGDPGTATAALRTRRGAFLGYLNITPRQGEEALRGWASFRLHHDYDEGDGGRKKRAA